MSERVLSTQAEFRIVALGASNTYGKGVSRAQTYPAQLQQMLGVKGIRAMVSNAGVNGNTTGEMLARLDAAVPAGTKMVILQPGSNDQRRGFSEDERLANIEAIGLRLRERQIKLIVLPPGLLDQLRGQSPAHVQNDEIHLTPAGYRLLAASILPLVLSAIEE